MKSDKKILLTHLIICIILVLLSLIGFAFKNYYIFMCTIISSTFALLYSFSLLKGASSINPNDTNLVRFILFTILKFFSILCGILIPALIIFFTKNNNKYDYLNLIAATIPFVIVTILVIVLKKNEEK